MTHELQTSSGEGAGSAVLRQLEAEFQSMSGWVKFLGIAHIVLGVIQALSVVGIVFAWLPIWMGVLLFQAGNRAAAAPFTHNPQDLLIALRKLRLFFVVEGIIILISLAVVLIAVLYLGSALFSLLQYLPEYTY